MDLLAIFVGYSLDPPLWILVVLVATLSRTWPAWLGWSIAAAVVYIGLKAAILPRFSSQIGFITFVVTLVWTAAGVAVRQALFRKGMRSSPQGRQDDSPQEREGSG